MKKLLNTLFVMGLCAGQALAMASARVGAADTVGVSDLKLAGDIDGENITFDIQLTASVPRRGGRLLLVKGDVAYLEGELPGGVEITRDDGGYVLEFAKGGKHRIGFRFASRAAKDDEWRETSFLIPVANVRELSVTCDRDDLEVRFPGALDIRRDRHPEKDKTRVTAFLGVSRNFQVRWKPEIKKLDSDLVVTCDANTIATANVGALRLDTVLSYRVIQGNLSRLIVALPDVNVTQVNGEDIQDWQIDRTDPAAPRLVVSLSRPRDGTYRLQVQSEMVLPEFPSSFVLPVLDPQDVLRTSGFLMIGTDSAIKMQITKAAGLTQVDQASFPAQELSPSAKPCRVRPSRSTYAYQYASTPYRLQIDADDIVTSLTSDDRITLNFVDNELVMQASLEVTVKDAAARELVIETDADPSWTVTSITGQHVSEADTDVREEGGKRLIYIPMKKAVTGALLVNVRMEKSLPEDARRFSTPHFVLRDAKSERGYIIAAAEKGIRLKATTLQGAREVHTGSAPMRVVGAQQAFRFKEAGWSLEMSIERTDPVLHSELFHLVSLGEGVMYCSAALTYHIAGAPIQEFQVRVPEHIEAAEFTGADIEGWTREGDVCTVRLQTKIMGDYTLLVTYDKQFDYAGAEISVGDIETIGTETEVGFIAAASSASLQLSEVGDLPPSIIPVDRDEIPAAYSSPVTDPIIRSYKYVRAPHAIMLKLAPLDTEQLLGQVADYVRIQSEISRDGDAVTTMTTYLKNASRQYLVVRLPKGIEKLWSIKVIDENGGKRDVLSQEDAQGRLLIPVRRPRDPNTALRVEVKYAQRVGELGLWSTGLRSISLTAPELPDTHATFAGWAVQVPEKFAIGNSSGGSMAMQDAFRYEGMIGGLKKIKRLCRALADGPSGYTLHRALSGGWGGSRSAEFTKSVNLAGSGGMELRLRVLPAWIGSYGSPWIMLGAAALGLAVLLVAAALWRRPLPLALGITLLTFAAVQSALGRSVFAVVVLLVILVALVRLLLKRGVRGVWWCLRGVWRAIWWILSGLFTGFRSRRSAWRDRRHQRKLGKLETSMAIPVEEPPPFEPDEDDSSTAGWTSPLLLLVLWVVACMTFAAVAETPPVEAVPELPALAEAPVLDNLALTLVGPGMGTDEEQSAQVHAVLEFRLKGPRAFLLQPAGSVLLDYKLSGRGLTLNTDSRGYSLEADREGSYRVELDYRVPVRAVQGRWTTELDLLPNLRNRVDLTLPTVGLEIQAPASVLFRTTEAAGGSSAEAVFGPVSKASFTWAPRVRKTRLEEAVYFCEVNTFAVLQAGVVELTSLLRYQIAQGELKEIRVSIPEGTSVTSVRAPGLATWSFDPETRLLEAILEKGVSGSFELVAVTQTASEGLPYAATLGVPRVMGVSRQRGSLAVAAPDTIQVRLEEPLGLTPMNIEDFSSGAVAAASRRDTGPRTRTVRRAFRYHQAADVSLQVQTERVLPELRVQESGTVSIGDERIVLATRLQFALAKTGIFSTTLRIPADYDVETLSGPDVSHWDEIKGDDPGVMVHFTRQVADSTEINLVVARTEKGIEQEIDVPRVRVDDARKHTGRLTVTGERGVRLMVGEHRGVDMKKASEAGIREPGVLVFDLLRPTWSITLRTDVLAPSVKPQVLQWVDLAEGMLQCRAYLVYDIENAGVKSFRIKSPMPGVNLSVTGRQIARVHEDNREEGIWHVDLHNKVQNRFAVNVSYQIPYDPAEKGVTIRPLQTLDTDSQRGFLVITCGGRVQVQPAGPLKGLKADDPRNVPSFFGAGDLSHAILCYATIRRDYELDLSVVRHDSADVLPASINQVRLTSALSTRGTLMTRAQIRMNTGNLRFLKMALPHPDDSLWTVLLDGREVATSRKGDTYYIPLEEQEGEQETMVDFVYAGASDVSAMTSLQSFEGPTFELPLNDIEWAFYVLPGQRYYGFGGNMERRDEDVLLAAFGAGAYLRGNKAKQEASWKLAKQGLDSSQRFQKQGRTEQAKKALKQALNYSQGQADLNEDARVQYRNLVKQQLKAGLVNRRDVVRFNNNILDAQGQTRNDIAQSGQQVVTQETMQQMESQLSDKDNDSLELVADKIIEQQAAAAGVVTAIRVAMPEHGRKLTFLRAMQIDPGAGLTVSFHASSGRLRGWLNALWPVVVLFGLLWFGLAVSARRRKA